MLKTLDQSLKILMAFTKEKPTWGARELAKELDIKVTNIYRILSTFEENRFLTKHPETKKYSLGLKFWEFGLLAYDNINISQHVRPILKELMLKTGESIFLTVLDGKEGLTLDVVEPEDKVKFSVSIGSRAPLYVGASYRSILAFMPEEFIQSILSTKLEAFTATTKTDSKELLEELADIRKKGWARSNGEYTRDVIALAYPIFVNGKIIGSITVSGPTYRFSEEQIESSIPLLKEATYKVTEVMEKYRLDIGKYLKN